MSKLTRPKTDAELGLDVLYTYRYLRGGMVALLLMLVFSVGYQAVMAGGCLLGSISAYYFTPARSVFVGSLFALGALLIVHKARSPEEDVLLDFSGFMAFVVALVPTAPDRLCGVPPALPAAEVADAVRNNIWSLIVVTAVAMVVRMFVRRRSGHETHTSRGAEVATWICAAILVVELGFFLLKRESFIALSHGLAAVTMVAGIIVVMVLNAITQEEDDARGRRFRAIYYGLALALGLSLAVTVALHLWLPDFRQSILVAELVVIALFGSFWVVQTVELWREEPEQIREQVQAAPRPVAAPPTGSSPGGTR